MSSSPAQPLWIEPSSPTFALLYLCKAPREAQVRCVFVADMEPKSFSLGEFKSMDGPGICLADTLQQVFEEC